jgi:hypothetical protein
MDERTQAPNLITLVKTALAATLIVYALGGARAAEPSEAKVKVTRIVPSHLASVPERTPSLVIDSTGLGVDFSN